MRQRVFVSAVLLVILVIGGSHGMTREVAAGDVSGTWTAVTGATPPAISRRIGGMAALSATDIWAVGWSNVTRPSRTPLTQPLIEHWDGSTWTALPAPTPMDHSAYLFAITAISPQDIWAVGSISPDTDGIGNAQQPLALHYDGTTWNQVSMPAAPSQGSRAILVTITAVSANDVWAAGRDNDAGLVFHWDGTQWHSVGAPSASGVVRDQLDWNGINAVSAHDVWLVGERRLTVFGTNGTQPVAAHWDGVAWTLVNTPLPAGSQNRLESIAIHAADDVWAVGSAGTPPDWPTAEPDMRMKPFVVHWDGSQWTEVAVPMPDPSATVTYLTAVVASGTDDLWVSGTYGVKLAQGDVITESAQTFFLHWDGARWAVVSVPSAAKASAMPFESPAALAAVTATDLWCGGQFQSGAASFLHYS